MRTAVKPVFVTPNKIQLPPSLLAHIRKDLHRVSRAQMQPGNIFVMDFPVKRTRLWLWDMNDSRLAPFLGRDIHTYDSVTDPAVVIIQMVAAQHPKGILIQHTISGMSTAFSVSIDRIAEDGDIRTIQVCGMSLRDEIQDVFGIREWQPPSYTGSGLVLVSAFNRWNMLPTINLYMEHGNSALISLSSAQTEISAASLPLIYMQSPYADPIPSPAILQFLYHLDTRIQSSVVFGEIPKFHVLMVGPEHSDSPLAVFRNIQDVESTGAAIERFLAWLDTCYPHATSADMEGIFRSHVIGTILERVSIEDGHGNSITCLDS